MAQDKYIPELDEINREFDDKDLFIIRGFLENKDLKVPFLKLLAAMGGGGGTDLPANILAALNGANSPGAGNVFATLADVPDASTEPEVINPGRLSILSPTSASLQNAKWRHADGVFEFSGNLTLPASPVDPNNRFDIVVFANGSLPIVQTGTAAPDPVVPNPNAGTLLAHTIYRPFNGEPTVTPVAKDPSTANQLGQWLGNDGFTPMYAPIWRQTLAANTYYDFIIAFVAFASDYSTVGQYPMNGLVMVDFTTKPTSAELDPTRTSVKSMGIGNRNSDFVLAMSGANQATLYARKGAYIGNMTFKYVVKKPTVMDGSLVNGGTYGALPTSVEADLYRSHNMKDYVATTGTQVRFDAPRSYGFDGTPVSGNITFPSNLGDIQNPTRASEGYMIKVLHNSSVTPTIGVPAPAGVEVVLDGGEYATNTDNVIYLICHKKANDQVAKVSYTITQNQG